MTRTRFEWTMIALSFLGGGWVTWTALAASAAGAAEGDGRGALEPPPNERIDGAASAGADAPTAADALATSPAPIDASTDTADRAAPSQGEQLQIHAVEGWRKLKERASNAKWKKELTEGVEGTAEKWWSGVREALGAAPSPPTPAPSPKPAPAKPEPESKPAREPIPPDAGPGSSGQIGDADRQNGARKSAGWLQRLLRRP